MIKIKILIILIFLSLGIANNNILAQIVNVPTDAQMELIPKILSLDKNFGRSDNDNSFGIGIIYLSNLRGSVKVKDDILDYAEINKIIVGDKTGKIIPIDLSANIELSSVIKDNNIKVIYIAPLRSFDLSRITKICKEEKIITFTGVSEFKQNDISVSFDLKENKLQISIDLKSALAEGAKFSSYLLNIVQVKN